jgi:SAM-dependent methyltransferase
VLGLEPSEDYDERLRAARIPFVHGLLENHSLPIHSFEVVYHCDLLVHFVDPLRSLSAMCELLTEHGVLCFEVGLMGGIAPLWYKLVGNIGLGPHRWLYSNRAFKDLMKKAGLRILHIQYFGLAPQVIGGRVTGLINNRLIRPVLRGLHADDKNRASRLQERCINFLRYRAGLLLPHIGPQTVLVVAKPTVHAK